MEYVNVSPEMDSLLVHSRSISLSNAIIYSALTTPRVVPRLPPLLSRLMIVASPVLITSSSLPLLPPQNYYRGNVAVASSSLHHHPLVFERNFALMFFSVNPLVSGLDES
jgi:hypothetical protein